MRSRPVALCFGPGHVLVYANRAFVDAFGDACVGMPAREALVDLPGRTFALLDAVLQRGRPLACWITRDGEEWRLTAAPRVDPETREVYGVTFHLRARTDLPVLADREGA